MTLKKCEVWHLKLRTYRQIWSDRFLLIENHFHGFVEQSSGQNRSVLALFQRKPIRSIRGEKQGFYSGKNFLDLCQGVFLGGPSRISKMSKYLSGFDQFNSHWKSLISSSLGCGRRFPLPNIACNPATRSDVDFPDVSLSRGPKNLLPVRGVSNPFGLPWKSAGNCLGKSLVDEDLPLWVIPSEWHRLQKNIDWSSKFNSNTQSPILSNRIHPMKLYEIGKTLSNY